MLKVGGLMKRLNEMIRNNYKWIILLFMSIIFIWLAIRVKGSPELKIDNMIYTFIHQFESPDLTKLFSYITNLISMPVICLVCLIFVLISIVKNNYRYCPFVVANLGLILILNFILKQIFARPRPDLMLVQAFGYSFPSGHAMVSMAFYGLFIYILFHSKIKKFIIYLLSLIILMLILLIGVSRIYLNVHYFSDVLAGFAVSIIYLIFFTRFMKAFFGDGVRKQKLYKSFYYAICGVLSGFKMERNMKIHVIVMLFVIIFGFLLSISLTEWLICLILFALVISLELVNTAIENTVDLITEEKCEKAKIAKDTMAAAVLVASICSIIVGLIIFIPKIFF